MKSIVLTVAGIAIVGCASTMTPNQFLEEFPRATQTAYYGRVEAKEAITNGTCTLLVSGRSYIAPNGSTLTGELKDGAKGVDEWVQLDGGNAYMLENYEWVTVGSGSTQLTIYFDTMLC